MNIAADAANGGSIRKTCPLGTSSLVRDQSAID
jgi:hypothetical protein